jgi:NADH-quinone oxidoreductase subunit L
MTYPLIILALLAALAGVLGVPHALGGANRIEEWFAPVFSPRLFSHGHAAAHEATHTNPMEYVLMLASVGIAVAGILVARAMYLTKSLTPEMFSEVAGGALYRWVYNKYYVDELYGAVFVNGTLLLARLCAALDTYVIDPIVNGSAYLTTFISWLNGWFDNYVIDGIVNRVADAIIGIGGRFRQLQTGSINGYLYVIVVGVVVVMVVRLM